MSPRVWVGIVCAVLLACAAPLSAAEVIANPSLKQAELNRSLLRGVFGMRVRAWPDGTPVRVFVLADEQPLHVEFCKAVLQVYPYQLRQNWDRLVYSGTGQPPSVVSSPEEMRRKVAETPGAIGYLELADDVPPATEKVKVLDVR